MVGGEEDNKGVKEQGVQWQEKSLAFVSNQLLRVKLQAPNYQALDREKEGTRVTGMN